MSTLFRAVIDKVDHKEFILFDKNLETLHRRSRVFSTFTDPENHLSYPSSTLKISIYSFFTSVFRIPLLYRSFPKTKILLSCLSSKTKQKIVISVKTRVRVWNKNYFSVQTREFIRKTLIIMLNNKRYYLSRQVSTNRLYSFGDRDVHRVL